MNFKLSFRTGLIILLFVLFAVPISGQQNKHPRHYKKSTCTGIEMQLDSVHVFTWNENIENWIPSTVQIYFGQNDPFSSEILYLDFTSRKNINRLRIQYDENELVQVHYFDVWQMEDWQLFQKGEYFYDDNGFRTKMITLSYQDSIWNPIQQLFYSTGNDGKILYYIRQMKDVQETWYDFDEAYFTYNSHGLPEKRVVIEFGHHDTIWTETYYYDENNMLLRLWTTRMAYDKLTGRYDIPMETMTFYYYDDLAYLSNVITKTLKDGTWINLSKSVYYYNYSFGHKVPVCHKGRTIYVSRNALKVHLDHGDCLGECSGYNKTENGKYEQKIGIEGQKKSLIIEEENDPFNGSEIHVYPNPANDYFSVELGDNSMEITEILMIDLSGKIVKRSKVQEKKNIMFESHDLAKGMYILKLIGNKASTVKKVIIE